MRRMTVLMAVVALVVIAVAPATVAKNAAQRNFAAPLSGGEEVDPPVETQATGVAKFQLSQDGGELSYKINVANIQGVVAAHIHCAPVGDNGPVGVTLFSGGPTGAVNGTLVQGVITAPNEGNACGWADLGEVVLAMQGGDTYVNVHTIPPGFPTGEVRGQVK